MSVIQVTSREFRENQKAFLDMVAKGIQVIIKRGKKELFAITPIDDDDLYFSPKMVEKINKSIQHAKEGKTVTVSTKEELSKLLDNL